MQKFIDATGQEWTIELNIETARAVRRRAKTYESLKDVDFLDYASLLLSLNDVFFAADLLYCVCEEEAKERNVDAEAFGRGLKGKHLFDAVTALTAEYLDFFPDPTTAEKMRAVVEKNRKTQEALCEAICGKTTELLDKAVADAESQLGDLFLEKSPLPEADTEPTQA